MYEVPWFPFILLLTCVDGLLTSHGVQEAQSVRGSVLVLPDTSAIVETACLDAARRMRRLSVPVSFSVHPSGRVGVSYIHWPASAREISDATVVLVHGFDSSCLEYRRLGSEMADRGIDTYAVDLLGWGFTQLNGVTSFSASAKIEALNSFITAVVGEEAPFCIAGASLGGASAIEVAAMNGACKGLILIDAQGFVDGIGPMASMPKPLAKLGVEVLRSVPLRSSANQMCYFDKETFATDEAVMVGRLHCLQDGWVDAMVSFMQSGGFSPSGKVPLITVPSLVLWGRQDGILDGNEFATKFIETLPDAELQWIEECGHMPHLEQPSRTAAVIAHFLTQRVNGPYRDVKLASNQLLGVGLAGAAALAAFVASDFLPVQ